MALTQAQIANQLVGQLRALDPSISAEIGTPERLLLDTFAEALAELQVDLNLIGGVLDITAKFGSDLDAFTNLFGFSRQSGSYATGYVTFSRQTASAYDITIPNGTQVQASIASSTSTAAIVFQTTTTATLQAGQTSVTVPIQAVIAGSSGNVAAQTITQFANLGSPILGITQVSNAIPTTNGSDQESDVELVARFQNTVFRNVAGTADQYIALAVATQFSTKANVIGPISRFQEYIQVPEVDDAGYLNGILYTNGETLPNGSVIQTASGNGTTGNWTTARSENPYAASVYSNTPYFVATSASGGATFYRAGVDYIFNSPEIIQGDAYRETIDDESIDIPVGPVNITFINVYQGSDTTVIAPRPGDVVYFEYSYLSTESRNNVSAGVTNCVDVYVNGQNPITANASLAPLVTGSTPTFNTTVNSAYNINNFERTGQPTVQPVSGHYYTPLFWQPLIALPDTIVAGTNTYIQGIHFFPVTETTVIGYTVRARDGIEWDPTIHAMSNTDPTVDIWTSGQNWTVGALVYYNGSFYVAQHALTNDTVVPSSDTTNWLAYDSGSVVASQPFSGAVITGSIGVSSIPVTGYTYDKNIVDLQTALNGAKQITTDVLAHAARQRYFKLAITVIYGPGQSPSSVNSSIAGAIASYFSAQSFGAVIQLSTLLTTVAAVSGVQNVRWTNSAGPMVYETDINGNVLVRSGSQVAFDDDFYLLDNQLPALPTGQLSTDSAPGLIVTSRAQNTFGLL